MRDQQNNTVWKIAGPAGHGIKIAGHIFSLLGSRSGYRIFGYTEYPSLIRGGHNTYQTVLSTKPVSSTPHRADILVALNKAAIDVHRDELSKDARVIYDPNKVKIDETDYKGVTFVQVPLSEIAKEAGGTDQMINIAAIGTSVALMGLDIDLLKKILSDKFGRKGERIVTINQKAADAGYNAVPSKKTRAAGSGLFTRDSMVLTGNEAISLGAIAAGCTFYAAYPMTPATSILHYLAAKADEVGMIVKHAEDEISAVNMVIGAGFAGARAMTGTAGGGFALMCEGLGLAAVAEVPVVIMVGQRPGPATGMPTWTCQSDLRFVMHASQDEFPRIVLAPGDPEEAFYMTVEAFNLAERYQTPVLLLTDKLLCESHFQTPQFDEKKVHVDRGKLLTDAEAKKQKDYVRYAYTEDGISPRGVPGQKGTMHLANSYEHDEYGCSTEEAEGRIKMMGKRMKKLETMMKDIKAPTLYGPKDAEITLVCWGSTKGAALEAQQQLEESGKSVNVLHFTYMMPFPPQAEEILKNAKRLVNVEGNYNAQFAGVIREKTGIEIKESILKYDGRPFWPEEIVYGVT